MSSMTSSSGKLGRANGTLDPLVPFVVTGSKREARGVPRLNRSRGKKHVWRSMFELEVIWEKIYCVKEKYLRHCWGFSALPLIWGPGHCSSFASPPYASGEVGITNQFHGQADHVPVS